MEIQILNWLQSLHTPILDKIMQLITHLGDMGIIWIILTIVMLLIPKTRKSGVIMAVALIVDVILCNVILKNLIARVRPYDVNTAVQVLVAKPKDFSFPSGHTAASFASVTALYLAGEKKLWKIALVLAVLIAFSRLYFICSLSNRRIRWNHNWSYCRLHRIQTNFYCPVKAQKEDVNGSSRLQLFSSVFLNKKFHKEVTMTHYLEYRLGPTDDGKEVLF